MRIPMTATAAAIFGIAACASNEVQWTKAGATPADYQRDTYECERDTRTVAYTFTPGVILPAIDAQNFFSRCMSAKGYVMQTTSQSRPVRQIMDTSGPPTPMKDPAGNPTNPKDLVLCKFPNVDPVIFPAQTCSQGRGYILGPAPSDSQRQ